MDKGLFIEKIVAFTRDYFGDNLSGILLYGTAVTSDQPRDYDTIIILKEKNSCLENLRGIEKLKNQFQEIDLDLQLLYKEEIFNANLFSLDTHGCFILKKLKEAEVLFGKNPFENFYPNSPSLKRSILDKIQYYVFRARQMFAGYKILSKDDSADFHRKKIKLIMEDLMLCDGKRIEKEIVQEFERIYPEILNVEESLLMTQGDIPGIEKLIMIYEKLYSFSLEKIKKDCFFSPRKPSWSNLDGIFFEYLFPFGNKNKKRAVVLCDGLPSMPSQQVLMNSLTENGFYVFFPRYKGTWESEGHFLERNPSFDIEKICCQLKEGLILDGGNFVAQEVILLGVSFGGAVALSLAGSKDVDKMILCSPVIDFSKVIGIESLGDFLKNNFAGAYRFDGDNWNKLISGKIIKINERDVSDNAKKITIFGDREDHQIKSADLINFSKKNEIKLFLEDNFGHLSLGKIGDSLIDKMLEIM